MVFRLISLRRASIIFLSFCMEFTVYIYGILWYFMVFYGLTEFFVLRCFVRFFMFFHGILWYLLVFSAFPRSVGFLSDKRIMYIPLYKIFKNAIIFTYFYARFLLIIVKKSGIILP